MKAEWAVWPPPFGLFCLVNAHCQHAQCERKVAGVAGDDVGDAAATDAIMVHAITILAFKRCRADRSSMVRTQTECSTTFHRRWRC